MRTLKTIALSAVVALGAATAIAQQKPNPESSPPAKMPSEDATLPLKLESGQAYVFLVERGVAEAEVLGSEERRPDGTDRTNPGEGERPAPSDIPETPRRVQGEKLRYELRVEDSTSSGSTLKVTVTSPAAEPMRPGQPGSKPGDEGMKPAMPEKNPGVGQPKGDDARTFTVKIGPDGEIRTITGDEKENLGQTQKLHRDLLELLVGSGLHAEKLQTGKEYDVGGVKLSLESVGERGMHGQVKFRIVKESNDDQPVTPGRPGGTNPDRPGDQPGDRPGATPRPGANPNLPEGLGQDSGHAIYDGENGLLESLVPAKGEPGGPGYKIRRIPTTEKPMTPGLPEDMPEKEKDGTEKR